MTSSPHGPYRLGYTRNTMAVAMRCFFKKSNSNCSLSTDCFLQLESMKSESLVIAYQHVAVNTFSGLVHTARQTMEVGCTLSRRVNQQWRQTPKVLSVTGVKS